MAKGKLTTGRVPSHKVLSGALASKVGNVIVIGTLRGEDYLATSGATRTKDQLQVIRAQIADALANVDASIADYDAT